MSTENSRRQFLKNTSLGVLGLGILPEIIKANNPSKKMEFTACNETTIDYFGQGPFYTPNAPGLLNNELSQSNEPGTKLILSGRVLNINCDEFIPNTEIDIWHANDAGSYDNTGFNLRGKTLTNTQGFYLFETVKPGLYLNGLSYRPSHIHFKITPPGFPTLTTQLYFQGDPNITNDNAASITSGIYDASDRIIPLTANSQGHLEGTWDIVIDGSGTALGLHDIHLDKGIIYQASPNPFSNTLTIQYGIFLEAKVGISVYDLQGREVAILEEETKVPEKYELVWNPENELPNGHYFIALKINALQVHYIKVLRNKQSYY